MNSESFDHVIVGAVSAGCVLANGLSEDADPKVLLVETGPADRRFYIHLPVAVWIILPTQRGLCSPAR